MQTESDEVGMEWHITAASIDLPPPDLPPPVVKSSRFRLIKNLELNSIELSDLTMK